MKSLSYKCTASVLLSVVLSSFANASSTSCIQEASEIPNVPAIESFVNQMGGLQVLQGNWKLGGLAGDFEHVVVSFETSAQALSALVQGVTGISAQWESISVCVTSEKGVLQVNVPVDQGSLLMKAGSKKTLQLAQVQNGVAGSFYTFEKE